MHRAAISLLLAAMVTVAAGCKDRPTQLHRLSRSKSEMEWGLNPRWDREPEVQPKPERLYGRWVVRRYEAGDFAFIDWWPDPKSRPPEFEIDSDGLRFTVEQDAGPPEVLKLPVRLHTDRSPKQFELVGPERTIIGIFKVLADERLVVALAANFGDDSKPRTVPTDFDSRRTDILVLICERVPPPTPIIPFP
jgi:hypothetical protein